MAAYETTENDGLTFGYTESQLKTALASLSSDEESCSHFYGFGDIDHQLSMLQRITAVRILDYERLMVRCEQF